MVFAGRPLEADRVTPGCAPDGLVVERHVPVTTGLADGAGQRRLAALPRTVDQNGRGIAERLSDAGREVAGERCGGSRHGR